MTPTAAVGRRATDRCLGGVSGEALTACRHSKRRTARPFRLPWSLRALLSPLRTTHGERLWSALLALRCGCSLASSVWPVQLGRRLLQSPAQPTSQNDASRRNGTRKQAIDTHYIPIDVFENELSYLTK